MGGFTQKLNSSSVILSQMKKMFHEFVLFCLCWWHLIGKLYIYVFFVLISVTFFTDVMENNGNLYSECTFNFKVYNLETFTHLVTNYN